MTLRNANNRLAYYGFQVRRVSGQYQARRFEWAWSSLKCFRHASLDAVMIWAGYDVMAQG